MRRKLYFANPTGGPAINPLLAKEIGLNESILLTQMDYWISLGERDPGKHLRDGEFWTYQSVRSVQKMFPFWSVATVQRIIESLLAQKLLIVGNYNTRAQDRTRWFAINYEVARRLNSIVVTQTNDDGVPDRDTVSQDETVYGHLVSQDETWVFQNETDLFQNETTLPETTQKTTTRESSTERTPNFPLANEEMTDGIVQVFPDNKSDEQKSAPTPLNPPAPVAIAGGWKAADIERLRSIVTAEYPPAGPNGGYRPSKADLDLLATIPRKRAKDFVAAVKNYKLKVKGEDTKYTRRLRNFLTDDFWEQFVAPPSIPKKAPERINMNQASPSDILAALGIPDQLHKAN